MGATCMKVSCVDQRLVVTTAPVIASGGRNENEIIFTFCPLWSDFAKVATFYRDEEHIYSALIENNRCVIPWEVLAEDGEFFFSVFGVSGDITRTSEVVKYKVIKGAITEVSDPTPDMYEQILEQLKANEELAQMTVDIVNSIRDTISYVENGTDKALSDANEALVRAEGASETAFEVESIARAAQASAERALENDEDRVQKTGDSMSGALRFNGTAIGPEWVAESGAIFRLEASESENAFLLTIRDINDNDNHTSRVLFKIYHGGRISLETPLGIDAGGTGAIHPEDALTNFGIMATATELNYMGGVRGNVQEQIDQINTDIGNVAADALEVTGAASSVVVKNLVPDRVLVSDANGKISEGPVSTSDLTMIRTLEERMDDMNESIHDDLGKLSPLTHEHYVKEIKDFPTSMPASDVPAWAKASKKPTYDAHEVGAAPLSHEHSGADIAHGTVKIEYGGTDADTAAGAEFNINGHMIYTTADVTDDSQMVFKYSAPTREKGVFIYKRAIDVWDWIRGKIRSVFGFSDTNVLSVGHGGTGANNAAGARSAIGAMSKSGDTSTGNIVISKSDPYLYLKNTNGGGDQLGFHWYGSSTNNNVFGIYDVVNGKHLLTIKQDGIVTFNKPLPVESGGTGAKDANGAQKNLFAPLKISETTDILTLTNGFYHFEGDSKKAYNWPVEKENHKFEITVQGNRNPSGGYWYVMVMDMLTGEIYYNHYYWSEWKGWKKLSMTAV